MEGGSQPPECLGESSDRPDVFHERVREQGTASRSRSGERARRHPLCSVDDACQHGEPGDAVCEHVMEHRDQRRLPFAGVGDDADAPEWPACLSRGRQFGCDIENRLHPTRFRTRDNRHVVLDLKVWIICPHRSTKSHRDAKQALPEPGTSVPDP
nr:hypothetical protein [Salinibacterium sp. ZJ450]